MNSIGEHFRLTTFGESHGPAVGGVIDGCPAGVELDMGLVDHELARRRGEGVPGTTPRKERDAIEWLSGLYEGRTLGTPIAFVVRNEDCRSEDYDLLAHLYRPGHGDYTWEQKYGLRDPRGGGRCSARCTVPVVIAGAIAKQLMKGIDIRSRAADGMVECTVTGLPVGLGEPLFGRLQSQLSAAMLSIPSATGFEFGEGFHAAGMSPEEYLDRFRPDFSTETNHCGGLMGGLSNGMPLRFRVAFHPIVSQANPLPCVDRDGKEHPIHLPGRHDRNHVPRAAVIAEALTALTIIDNML